MTACEVVFYGFGDAFSVTLIFVWSPDQFLVYMKRTSRGSKLQTRQTAPKNDHLKVIVTTYTPIQYPSRLSDWLAHHHSLSADHQQTAKVHP